MKVRIASALRSIHQIYFWTRVFMDINNSFTLSKDIKIKKLCISFPEYPLQHNEEASLCLPDNSCSTDQAKEWTKFQILKSRCQPYQRGRLPDNNLLEEPKPNNNWAFSLWWWQINFVGSEIQQQQLSNSVPGGLNQHLNSYIE